MPPRKRKGGGGGDDTDEPALSSQDVKAKLRGKRTLTAQVIKVLNTMGVGGKDAQVFLMTTLAFLGLAALAYVMWPKGKGAGMKVPAGMESLSSYMSIPGVDVKRTFQYVRTPETWVYWKSDTVGVSGAVDRISQPGERFMEKTVVEGKERDVTWVTTYAGVDAQNSYKMKLQLNGNVKDMERGLRNTFIFVRNTKTSNSTYEEVMVTQTLFFGHKGLSAEQREAVRKGHKAQMSMSLHRLAQRLSSTGKAEKTK